ncbi:hypothetical protein [Bradyrhizobium sp. ARR65]|uniref:hypothetical protein n=1 Tax=Bradyrhizobium sp. ARR65 TaxID=1040989 RepID=UPI0004641646|nr:hypothetical protein [Bradyrhizobium sp. ARR65]
MGTTVNTYRSAQVWEQIRKLPDACRAMLDAFVSRRMQHAASAVKHIHSRRDDLRGIRFNVSPTSQADTPAVEFGLLDPNVISGSIPAFFIGRNTDGLWVVREAKGRIGGLFILKRSAISFAHDQSGTRGCATIFPTEGFELDLENKGNLFAGYLAPLLRLEGFSRMIRRCRRLRASS